MTKRRVAGFFLAGAAAVLVLAVQAWSGGVVTPSAPQTARPPQSLRLYVLDCGTLHNSDAARYRFKREELATLDMSVDCLLVAHPQGTLVWDTGPGPDRHW